MNVYLKYDTSKESKEHPYYFSDGGANISENMTYKQSIDKKYFMKSIGIVIIDLT